jgi:hypothetical protein
MAVQFINDNVDRLNLLSPPVRIRLTIPLTLIFFVCFVLPPFSFKFSSLSSSPLHIFFSQITSADIPPPPPKGWIFSTGYRTPLRKPIKNECPGTTPYLHSMVGKLLLQVTELLNIY